MMEWQRDNGILKARADKMPAEELQGKMVIGCFHEDKNVPEYTEEYGKLIAKLAAKE